jgi:HEAT repeat protein
MLAPRQEDGASMIGAPAMRTPVRELNRLLRGGPPEQRLEAARALAAREDAAGARLLVTALARAALPAYQLVLLLGRPWATDALLVGLDHADDLLPVWGPPPGHPPLRGSIARALGRTGDPRALGPLRGQLAADDPRERRAARRAIRRLQADAHVVVT